MFYPFCKTHMFYATLQYGIGGGLTEKQQRVTGIILKNNYVDLGYHGVKEVLGTKIIIPDSPNKDRTPCEKQKLRKRFKRRATIEPKIGHLKQDHRLSRNFYKRIKGDNNNVMLAAAAMNFKRMMNKCKEDPQFVFIDTPKKFPNKGGCPF